MKAFKCNRCGAYQDGEGNTLYFGKPVPVLTGKLPSIGYDLCNRCYKELEKFLKGKDND